MTYVEIGATFLTTFLGVFLAFGLENYRQRRRTTAWVRRHLEHLLGALGGEVSNADAVDGPLREQRDACTAWLTAQDGLTDRQWELVGAERFRDSLEQVAAQVAAVRAPLRSTVTAARAWLR
jgi:hypothetical protein